MTTTATNGSATVATNGQANGSKLYDQYSYLGKDPIRAEVCTSEEQFELERERIFKKVIIRASCTSAPFQTPSPVQKTPSAVFLM